MRACRLGLRRSHCPTLLKAFAAEDRAALRGTERDRGLFTALRAGRFGFRADLRAAAATGSISTLGLTGLAAFGLVLEALVGEEHLLAGSKHKLGATIRALQYFIVVFHEPPPLTRAGQGMGALCTMGLFG